jgi:hypothetical protein
MSLSSFSFFVRFHKPLDKKTAGPQPTRANGADDSKSESASSHSHSQTRVAGLETLFDGTPMPVNTETALVATQHLQLLQTTIKTQADAFAEYKEASQSEMKRKNEELARKDVNSQKYVDGLEAQTNLPAGMNAVLNVCVKMSKEITANPADQDSIVCKYRNTWLQYRGLATKVNSRFRFEVSFRASDFWLLFDAGIRRGRKEGEHEREQGTRVRFTSLRCAYCGRKGRANRNLVVETHQRGTCGSAIFVFIFAFLCHQFTLLYVFSFFPRVLCHHVHVIVRFSPCVFSVITFTLLYVFCHHVHVIVRF